MYTSEIVQSILQRAEQELVRPTKLRTYFVRSTPTGRTYPVTGKAECAHVAVFQYTNGKTREFDGRKWKEL